jgi:hypothetical protein
MQRCCTSQSCSETVLAQAAEMAQLFLLPAATGSGMMSATGAQLSAYKPFRDTHKKAKQNVCRTKRCRLGDPGSAWGWRPCPPDVRQRPGHREGEIK